MKSVESLNSHSFLEGETSYLPILSFDLSFVVRLISLKESLSCSGESLP